MEIVLVFTYFGACLLSSTNCFNALRTSLAFMRSPPWPPLSLRGVSNSSVPAPVTAATSPSTSESSPCETRIIVKFSKRTCFTFYATSRISSHTFILLPPYRSPYSTLLNSICASPREQTIALIVTIFQTIYFSFYLSCASAAILNAGVTWCGKLVADASGSGWHLAVSGRHEIRHQLLHVFFRVYAQGLRDIMTSFSHSYLAIVMTSSGLVYMTQ